MSVLPRAFSKDKAHVIEGFGRCIYCGVDQTTTKLYKEHVLPRALGGTFIIRKASCIICANTITKFEQPVLRNYLGHFREKNNYKSDHPKDRSGFRPAIKIVNDKLIKIDVRIEDHPSSLVLPVFKKGPRILQGFELGGGMGRYGFHSFYKDGREGVADAVGWEFDCDNFVRFIAKIAHGLVMSFKKDIDFKPTLIDIILGKKKNYSLYIGRGLQSAYGETIDGIFSAITYQRTTRDGKRYIMANIQLFSNIGTRSHGTPIYSVVAGIVR